MATTTQQARVGKIGSSDIAAVLGLSPFKTPMQAWESITGRRAFDGNPDTQRGHIMEPAIAQLYEIERGVELSLVGEMAHPDKPWLIATPDRIASVPDATDYRQWIVECKAPRSMRAWRSGVPEMYLCQVLHQIEIARYHMPSISEAHVIAHCGVSSIFEVQRDAETVAKWWQYVEEWYDQHVLKDTPPPPLPKPPVEYPDARVVGAAEAKLVRAYVEAAELEAQAKAEKDEAADALRAMMGENESVAYDGVVICRYPMIESRRVNLDALRAKFPEAAEACTEVTTSRRLTPNRKWAR